MNKAREAFEAATLNYFTVLGNAMTQFNQVKELFPNQTFWPWAAANYPLVAAAERTRNSAQTELYRVMQAYFGPDAAVLSGYMDRITNSQSSNAYPG